MRQRGALADGEHRGDPTPIDAGQRVPHGVDPAMNDMEPASGYPVVDGRGLQPETLELWPRCDRVLARSEVYDNPPIRPRVESTRTIRVNSTLGGGVGMACPRGWRGRALGWELRVPSLQGSRHGASHQAVMGPAAAAL